MSFVVSHAARGTTCVDGVATASALCVPVHWHGHPAFPSQHESVASRLAGLWEHGGTGLGTLKNVCDCYTIIRESIHQRNFVYRVTSIYIWLYSAFRFRNESRDIRLVVRNTLRMSTHLSRDTVRTHAEAQCAHRPGTAPHRHTRAARGCEMSLVRAGKHKQTNSYLNKRGATQRHFRASSRSFSSHQSRGKLMACSCILARSSPL